MAHKFTLEVISQAAFTHELNLFSDVGNRLSQVKEPPRSAVHTEDRFTHLTTGVFARPSPTCLTKQRSESFNTCPGTCFLSLRVLLLPPL
jgi:hypothetical protein